MIEYKNITKPFYSNCFREAVRAKLKNWKNVKIQFAPPWVNEVFCPHFLWTDGKYDYDFGVNKVIKWYQIFCFKGTIRRRRLGWNNEWLAAQKQWHDKHKKHSLIRS